MEDELVRALFRLGSRLDLAVWWTMWLGSVIEVSELQMDEKSARCLTSSESEAKTCTKGHEDNRVAGDKRKNMATCILQTTRTRAYMLPIIA